ncbi:MGH1-like glycoside hydrolase domain-containing protein [Cryptosporangium phraense]|uniref:Glucosidase n=1 Tax=Cryptosporangium phraense TaxID=2593070 RepID=A0A545APY5_9ACTN|nr:glucosidase [Cryptosporangium phraense]TQS43374.1 glucosidase [Cryptosporangium phraense]
MSAERERVAGFGRLDLGLRQASDWYLWGPYLSERQWGTVREDYSADGQAWTYLPHDHARSRAYRWGEDGLAGFSDVEQRLCLGLALWNERDPILKERIYGLTGAEGNHGEDAKEYWWFLDALPSHAWNRWRYHYPQAAFPYEDLRSTNASRGRHDPEYELLDTGVFDDDRYWVVEVDYAKADPTDLLMTIRVTNAGPDTAPLHVLPQLWYRNTWSWRGREPEVLEADGNVVRTTHPFLGDLVFVPEGAPELLFCDNETNTQRLYGTKGPDFPKDGIGDHVIHGDDSVNPQRRGSRCAAWYRLSVPGGETVELRLRLRPAEAAPGDFDDVRRARRAEADEFHAELAPDTADADEAAVLRQAVAGLLWSKQFYAYDVARWLDGDPAQPPPPLERRGGRNARWRTFQAFDIMSMPDTWEYPWFAAWDLAFQCVALAHVDPAFAKYQLSLLCREWFQHPDGALPAYEWDFGDVNPPVQAWAVLEVFALDGGTDLDFLSRVFDKLLVNFTWWINRQDTDGDTLFGGGFMGLDNIGPIDRSHLPPGWILEQADSTGWMASYAAAMATIAAVLDRAASRPALDLVQKFLEHFAQIREALDGAELWDEETGLFNDRLTLPDGRSTWVQVRSMVSMIPMLAVGVVSEEALGRSVAVGKRFARFLARRGIAGPDDLVETGLLRGEAGHRSLLVGVVSVDRVQRMLQILFDESEFLSPHGLRSLSARHRDQPAVLDFAGIRANVDYEPAESTIGMFGGNSNWRGPVWFPVNHLVVSALERYYRFYGDDVRIEYPTGSGHTATLNEVAADLRGRLVGTFLRGADGSRPCFGGTTRLQTDPRWRDNILFHEYFHGDNGAGLGATHQTGWTGLVVDLIRRRHGAVTPTADVVQRLITGS